MPIILQSGNEHSNLCKQMAFETINYTHASGLECYIE